MCIGTQALITLLVFRFIHFLFFIKVFLYKNNLRAEGERPIVSRSTSINKGCALQYEIALHVAIKFRG